jgi:hypothetical protein
MRRFFALIGAILLGAACTAEAGGTVKSNDSAPPDVRVSVTAPASTTPEPVATTSEPDVAKVEFGSLPDLAVISTDGHVVVVRNGEMNKVVSGIVSSDGSTLVQTSSAGDVTAVDWVNLGSGKAWGHTDLSGVLTAVAADPTGRVVAFRAPIPETAGTELVIATAQEGEAFRHNYGSELVPEGFANFMIAGSRIPAGMFVIEYLDPRGADPNAPRRYRVRVVDTASGELQLPLNLRDKTQSVDEDMLGFSRTHVTSHRDGGLLFTLYRGLEEDESGYAFVHTLGFVNGVYCLDLPSQLGLAQLPGAVTLADRERVLLVLSANGTIASFVIGDILDPDLIPAPVSIAQAWSDGSAASAPSAAVNGNTLLVGHGSTLHWLDASTFATKATQTWDMNIEGVALLANGDAIAAGTRRISQITADGQLAAEQPLPPNFGQVASILAIGE